MNLLTNLTVIGTLLFLHATTSNAQNIEIQKIESKNTQLIQSLQTTKGLKARMKLIETHLDWANAEQKKIKPKPNTASFDLHLKYSMLIEFIKLIPTKNFQKKDCSNTRNSIFLGFSPRNDFPQQQDAPPEALTTLKILSILCENPEIEVFNTAP